MILQIQYLRGLAALMVVAFHLSYQAALLAGGEPAAWTGIGAAGVDIFFVISGFIMWVTTADGRTGPLRFYGRRILRIVPLYWAVTLVVVVVMLAAPRLLSNSRFDAAHVLASFAFFAWPHPVTPDKLNPVVIPGWTLNYEMFFYALFGLFLVAGRYAPLVGMLGLLSALVILGYLVPSPSARLAFYTAPIMLEFAFGMVLGAIYGAIPRLDARLGWLALGLGAAALIACGLALPGVDRVVIFGLPAASIVFGTLYVAGGGTVGMRRLPFILGQASYAIYLTQVVSLAAFRTVWHAAHLPVTGVWVAAFVGAGLCVVSLVGVAVYRWFEDPVSDVTHRRLIAPRRRASAAIGAPSH